MSLSPPPSGIQLDDTHFDCVLLGTSLTNTLLAAALAKLGKKVLHIDRNDYYGALDTSLPFNDFAQLIHEAAHSHSQPTSAQADHGSEQISGWRAICGDSDSQRLSFHSVTHSSPLYAASSASFVPSTTAPAPSAAVEAAASPLDTQQAAAVSSDSDVQTSATTTVPIASSDPSSLLSSPLSLPASQSRQYSLDVTPHLLLSRAQLVELLIVSSTSSYIEFKAVDQSYLCLDERSGLQQVPVSRSSVFTSTLISMAEKRQLMRLLAAVMPNHKVTAQQSEEDRKDIAQWSELPFAYWLQHRSLSPRLTSFVAYAIALLDYRQDVSSLTAPSSSSSSSSSSSATASSSTSPSASVPHPLGTVTTDVGISRMRRHFHSIGRYSPGAFLYPIYGMGELPQAFARFCAVHGGIYILRYQPVCVVSEATESGARRVKGFISEGGQLVTADSVVCDREYVGDDSDGGAAASSVSCAVCVVDGRVLSGAGEPLDDLVQCVFPPLSVRDNQHPVRAIQLSSSAKAAPDGRYVLYLATPSSAASISAADELQPVIDYLTQRPTAQHVEAATHTATPHKPTLLHAFYYKRKQRPAITHPTSTPSSAASVSSASTVSSSSSSSSSASFHSCINVLVSGDSSPLSSLDSHVSAAQLLLDRVMPGAELLAALTSSRAEGAGGDEEKQQLDQLNILNSVMGVSSSGQEDEDAALDEDDTKEQPSAASPAILPVSGNQEQELAHQRDEEHKQTDGSASTAGTDENAVLDSLDDLTFD